MNLEIETTSETLHELVVAAGIDDDILNRMSNSKQSRVITLQNNHETDIVYINTFDGPAILGKGIRLKPDMSIEFKEENQTYISLISEGGNTKIGIAVT